MGTNKLIHQIPFVFLCNGEIQYEMLLVYDQQTDDNEGVSLTSVIEKLSSDINIDFMKYTIGEIYTTKNGIKITIRPDDVPLLRMHIINNIIG